MSGNRAARGRAVILNPHIAAIRAARIQADTDFYNAADYDRSRYSDEIAAAARLFLVAFRNSLICMPDEVPEDGVSAGAAAGDAADAPKRSVPVVEGRAEVAERMIAAEAETLGPSGAPVGGATVTNGSRVNVPTTSGLQVSAAAKTGTGKKAAHVIGTGLEAVLASGMTVGKAEAAEESGLEGGVSGVMESAGRGATVELVGDNAEMGSGTVRNGSGELRGTRVRLTGYGISASIEGKNELMRAASAERFSASAGKLPTIDSGGSDVDYIPPGSEVACNVMENGKMVWILAIVLGYFSKSQSYEVLGSGERGGEGTRMVLQKHIKLLSKA